MPCNLATTQAAACVSGIGKLTDPVQLLQVIAELSCELAVSVAGSQTPWTQNINAAGFNITNLGLVNGVKVYRALLTQSGTDAPVATVLENTLGGVPVWSRADTGQYFATLAGAFTVNKTSCIVGSILFDIGSGTPPCFLFLSRTDSDSVRFLMVDYSGTPTDSGDHSINSTAVEILVYP